jgi:hypothetical protein
LKLSLAVLLGFVICILLFGMWPRATMTKVVGIVYGLVFICWLCSGSGGILDRRPKTQAQKEWEEKLGLWWSFGGFALFALIGLIIFEPMYAVFQLMVILAGIGCAFWIRLMNRD